jgi:predicted metal-dependent phosphoesterase TrpH
VAELHCHSTASDGTIAPESLVTIADSLGLDVLAITDHDTIDGALRARDHARIIGANVEVVIGMEITTRRQDHVVGLFLDHAPNIFRPITETVDAIHAQGGLAIVAHPFLGLPSSISTSRLQNALKQCQFDGIETENPYLGRSARKRIDGFLEEHGGLLGAQIGASDSHFGDLARAVTLFEGHTAIDLRRAIESQSVIATTSRIRHTRPSLQSRLHNQYRSLIRMPIIRAAILWRQRNRRSE